MLRCRAFINLISRRSVAINETNSQSIKPESLRPDSSFPEAPAIESWFVLAFNSCFEVKLLIIFKLNTCIIKIFANLRFDF